jgi:two-component system NtrC family sensor kinase
MEDLVVTKGNQQQEIEALKAENLGLLDELESAYRHLEEILGTKNYETEIAYQELRKRNQALQERLAELQRAHSQLQEAQRLLVRAERLSAMGQMAAAIVHEINNPLTVLSGRVQMLLMKERVEYREELKRIQEATLALMDMTRNILRFARQKRTEQVPFTPLDLNSLIDQVLDFFQPLMKKIEVRRNLAPGLPQLLGNAAQIEQVLTNFLLNAADAMEDQQHGQLTISTGKASLVELLGQEQARRRATCLAIQKGESELPREGLWISVEDNGPGIAAETMGQIFEAFFTTKGEDQGTGLGLAICRSIAESFQGNILVSSRPGEGASFWLFLPAGPR